MSAMMYLNIGKPPALYRAAFYPVAVPLSIRNADFYRGNNIYIKSGEIGISEERGIYYAPLFFYTFLYRSNNMIIEREKKKMVW